MLPLEYQIVWMYCILMLYIPCIYIMEKIFPDHRIAAMNRAMITVMAPFYRYADMGFLYDWQQMMSKVRVLR